ncbi:MAG: hypothetical protein AAF387_19095, partial [Pseudomonadota bacterium]
MYFFFRAITQFRLRKRINFSRVTAGLPLVLRCLLIACVTLLIAEVAVAQEKSEEDEEKERERKTEKITVEGIQEPPQKIEVDPLDSANHIGLEEITRAQATD